MRIALAVLHLVALGIGFGAIYSRGRQLNKLGTDPEALRRAFTADAWWGIAAILWIGTGLWRALAGTEKLPSYYWNNHIFYAKMGMLAVVLLLEIWPMVTLIRWRVAIGRALPTPAELAPIGRRLARVCDVQLLLIVCIVIAATMMARGYGAQ